ncbi:MAG: response regulator [Rhodospirillaceae bacterium]|nr:response regulator [Rhodospirillaceae bacterium]
MGHKILLIEDDKEMSAYIAKGLDEAGFLVDCAADGRDGLFHATDGSYDAIILDRMLPVMDGMAVLGALRAAQIETPVIILSALGSPDDRIDGLTAGSDDYLVKPFAFAELLARINLLIRKGAAKSVETTLECEDLHLDLLSRKVRRKDKPWWKGEYWLDGVKWIDYGADPTALISAFDSGEVDTNHETGADSLEQAEAAGLTNSEMATGSTIVARLNVNAEPYTDVRVRRAAQLAVDNAVVLEIGLNNKGKPAENHHVSPIHIEYADVGPHVRNVAEAKKLLADAGKSDHEYELISLDDDWQKSTADAIAGQMRDAGLKVARKVIPAATFWNDWTKYPFSCTEWLGRPLGVQVLALAYKSGVPWNESGYSDPEFDALLEKALATPDTEARRAIMAEIEKTLRNSGVIIQPYWRSVYRTYRAGVHGCEQHQALEQHLDRPGSRADRRARRSGRGRGVQLLRDHFLRQAER